jgi:hypothetical protein
VGCEARTKDLVITWREPNYVQLRNDQGFITSLTIIHDHTERIHAVREVFQSACLSPTRDGTIWNDASTRLLVYPVDATRVGQLFPELLRRGFALAENSEFKVHILEDDAS